VVQEKHRSLEQLKNHSHKVRTADDLLHQIFLISEHHNVSQGENLNAKRNGKKLMVKSPKKNCFVSVIIPILAVPECHTAPA